MVCICGVWFDGVLGCGEGLAYFPAGWLTMEMRTAAVEALDRPEPNAENRWRLGKPGV